MNNDELYDLAIEAITNLFNDKSVTQSRAKENLENLIEDIKTMIDSLEVDSDY